MQSDLVCLGIRRSMEGAAVMGEMEIIKLDTGDRTIIEIDGTVIKDQVIPPKIEWCDRCQMFKELQGGKFDKVMGSNELWYCAACK
jgi:hypothetical protein